MTFDASLPLELLNGAAVIVDGFFLAWGIWYLRRESLRIDPRSRKTFWSWVLRTPPHMNLIVAVLVHDSGVWLRSLVVWSWRRLGAGDLSATALFLLTAGAVAIVVGGLCKIRAVTKGEHGDWPWLAALYVLAIFLAGSLIGR